MNWEVLGTWGAVAVAIVAVALSFYQSRKGFEEQRDIAREDRDYADVLAVKERRHQSRPILLPDGEVSEHLTSGFINWQKAPSFSLRNVGNGVALDIKAALYGTENGDSSAYQAYAYWHIAPIAPDNTPQNIIYAAIDPSDSIGLSPQTTVDGKYHLYNASDARYRIARLTLTYRDIFDKHETCYVSVFDYLLLTGGKHFWMHLATTAEVKQDIEALEEQRVPNARRIRPEK